MKVKINKKVRCMVFKSQHNKDVILKIKITKLKYYVLNLKVYFLSFKGPLNTLKEKKRKKDPCLTFYRFA